MTNPRIISVGKRADFPREQWSPQDRAREDALRQATRPARKPELIEPLPTHSGPPVNAWESDRDHAARQIRTELGRRLEKFGLRKPEIW